jgi:hypothetical protein
MNYPEITLSPALPRKWARERDWKMLGEDFFAFYFFRLDEVFA